MSASEFRRQREATRRAAAEAVRASISPTAISATARGTATPNEHEHVQSMLAAAEVVEHVDVDQVLGDLDPAEVTPPRPPTQVAHPWRATVRTAFGVIVALASMWALVVEALGLDPGWAWVGASLTVAAAITRVMALPAVETFLRRFVPWLAADTQDDA